MPARLFKILIFLLAFHHARCQLNQDSLENVFSIWYDSTVGSETNPLMYNAIYVTALRGTTTHQYFDQRVWQKGNLNVMGEGYGNVPMLFDIELEQLVIKHPDDYRFDGIAIDMDILDSFDFGRHQFRKFVFSNGSGFFEILFDGNNLLLLAKRKKRSTSQKGGVEFEATTSYYLVNEDRLVLLKGLKTIKNLYPANIKDIQQVKKVDKKKFRINKEASIVQFVQSLDAKMKDSQ